MSAEQQQTSGSQGLDPDEKAAIISVASYTRKDLGRSTGNSHDYVPSASEASTDVPTSLRAPFDTQPSADLGFLRKLPVEIFLEIFEHLPVEDWFNFRQVNRKARQTVHNSPEYQRVTTYGLQCLQAILRDGVGDKFTFDTLDYLLHDPECQRCGAFGDFIYLPKAERYCIACLNVGGFNNRYNAHSNLFTIALTSFCKAFPGPGRSKADLRKLVTVVRTKPGRYFDPYQCIAIEDHMVYRRYEMINLPEALAAIGEPLLTATSATQRGKEFAFRFHRTPSHMVSVHMPFFDWENQTVHRGLCCRGCSTPPRNMLASSIWDPNRDRLYLTEDDFLRHYQTCQKAQILYKTRDWSDEELRSVNLISRFIEQGGYSIRR